MATMKRNGLPWSAWIADDSAIVRERLSDLLHEVSGVSIVGETEAVTGTLEEVRRFEQDVT